MKYIIFDLDDTILNSQKKVSNKTLNVLNKCQRAGNKLVFNTARGLENSKNLMEIIKPDYAILNAGALIVDKDMKVIYTSMISKEDTKKIIEELIPFCDKLSVQTADGFYASDKNYKGQNAIYFDFSKGFEKESFKIIPYTKDIKKLKEVVQKYNLEFSTYLGGYWHRLNSHSTSKFNGILVLLKKVNSDLEDVITFGDDVGDLEMLEKASIGVAMKNSHPKVLEKIKNVTLSNDEDGVAVFLEKYILNE